jgi:hypothetical protein
VNDGRLGGAIDHRGGKPGKPSGDAAIVDDAARTLTAHMGRGVLHPEHDAAHQGRHRGVEAIDFETFDTTGLGRASGIVEKAIDAAEFFYCLGDQRAHLLLNRYIGLTEDTGRAELLRQRLAFSGATPGDDDFCAFGDKYLGRPQTNAAGRAGDHRNLAVKPSHMVLPDSNYPGPNIPSPREQSKQRFIASARDA